MAMRKPFMPPNASGAAAAGSEPIPGMRMPPQAGRTGQQPMMPMGGTGTPGGPQGPQPQTMGVNMGNVPGTNMTAGGPTSPMNISAMLQAKLGDRSVPPGQGPGQGPQSASGMPGGPMMPWGTEGMGMQQGSVPGAPKRVPYSNGMNMGGPEVPGEAEGDGDPDDPTGAMNAVPGGNAATTMMKLLRTMGRI